MSDMAWCGVSVTALVSCCAFTDVRWGRIPNALTLSAVAAGILVHTLVPTMATGAGFALAGAAVGGGLFALPFALGGMGGGDVKLMAGIGAWIGTSDILWVALYAAGIGGIFALGGMLWKQRRPCLTRVSGDILALLATRRPAPDMARTNTIPYAPAIALGWLTFLVFGKVGF